MWFRLASANWTSTGNLGTMDSISGSWTVTCTTSGGIVKTTGDGMVTKGGTWTGTFTLSEGAEFTSATLTPSSAGTVTPSTSGSTITVTIANVSANCTLSVVATGGNSGGSGGTNPPVTPPSGDDIIVYMTDYTVFGQSLMWYRDDFKLMSGGTVDTKYKSQLVACDVSNYVGQNIKITANQAVIDGAYYAFFLNDILYTGYAPEDLPSKTTGANSGMDANKIVEKFVVSATNEVTNTVIKRVPARAKYLYFANFNQKQENIPNVELA